MHSQINLINLDWNIFWIKSCGIKFDIHTVKLVWRKLSKMNLEKIATVNTIIEIKSKRKTWHKKRKEVWSIDSTFAGMQELVRFLMYSLLWTPFRGGGTVYTLFEDNPGMLQRII